MTLPVADRVRPIVSDSGDSLGLIRDAVNATYYAADMAGDIPVRRVALTMLAHLAKERRAAKLPEFKKGHEVNG